MSTAVVSGKSNSESNKSVTKRCHTLCAKLDQVRKEGLLCDAAIVVQGKEFPVHKDVLYASSSYFSAMFAGHFSEKNEEKVEILGVSAEIFSMVLDYMYGLDIKITLPNVLDVYRAADMLCVDSLIAECILYVKSNNKIWEHVELVYEVATRLEMHDICVDIMDEARRKLSSSDVSIVELAELSYSFLYNVLEGRSTILRLQNELGVVKNILKWAFLSSGERIPDPVLKVLSAVHFQYITQHDFINILDFISEHERLSCTESLSQLKDRLKAAYRQSHQKAIDQGFQLVLPHFSRAMSIYVFSCETWTWKRFKSEVDQYPEASLLRNNQLYIFTDSNGRKFDLKSKLDDKLPQFPETRVESVFSVVNNTVYIIGGIMKKTIKHAAEILELEPSSDCWKTAGKWKEPKKVFSSIAHGHRIFLLGENSSHYPYSGPTLMELLEYNTLTKNLKKVFTFPNLQMKPCLVIYENVLYIFSGISRQITESHFQAFDLNQQKIVTSEVSALELDYPVLTARPVDSGVLIAQYYDNTILLTLYRPTGDCPTELLGVVSWPGERLQFENLNLLFYLLE